MYLRQLLVTLLLALGVVSMTAAAQSHESEHAHEHAAALAGSEILPPLGEHGWHHQIVEVTASTEGFTPTVIHVRRGEPIVVVFSNMSDTEHHFHILGLEPEELSWFMVDRNSLDAYDPEALFAVTRAADHICDSETGICKLGINVHLHANPQSFDAVMFTSPASGTFEVVCPLHEHMAALFVVE